MEKTVQRKFSDIFLTPAEYRIKAPGRVNLIGEHTDYNGCPVLPMAIQYEINVLAAGARLTGAGFGGCAVALVPDPLVEGCKEFVKKYYYEDYLHVKIENTETVLFPCKPSSGASVRKFEE